TMLEWYRAHEPYETLMADCAALLAEAAKAIGVTELRYKGRSADPFVRPVRVSVAQAFERFAGIDLLATLPRGVPDAAKLADAAHRDGVRVAADDTWSDIFSRVLVERIENNLGDSAPTF